MTATTTLRLPESLRADADAYAASLGISLNALCAVALRDYLHARTGAPASPAAPERPPVVPAPEPVRKAKPAPQRQKAVAAVALPVVYEEPARGIYEPCPCGSGKKWKWCHGAR